MGVSVWVRLQRVIPGVDPLRADGKLLAKAMDVLDDASRQLNVRPLSEFYSVSKKQAMAEIGENDLSDEEWEALADDHVWWPAADGLASVTALLDWVTNNQDRLNRPEAVLADLRDCQTTLEAAVREGLQFNIAVSA